MVRHLKGLAGSQNSLKDVGAGGGNYGNAQFTNEGTHDWVVPAGVTSVALVAVGGGGTRTKTVDGDGVSTVVKRGAAVLCLAVGGGTGDTAVRDGGGDEGAGAAGGYSGNGNSGTGGAPSGKNSRAAGGVGLWGEGPSGGVDLAEGGSGGQNGEVVYGTTAGGGNFGASAHSTDGGGLSYVNDLAVTAGETLTIIIGRGGYSTIDEMGSRGGVNIIWGRGSFPNLDGVTVEAGAITIGAI